MSWLIARFGPTVGKIAFWLIIALLALALLGTAKCAYDRSKKVEVDVAKGQADAATKSGADAVNSVGKQQASEVETDRLTQENEDAIRGAEGADATVAPDLRDAGLRSLCKRAAYRGDPRCVQQPPP